MERRREASVTCHRSLDPGGDYDSVEVTARRAIHAQTISIAVRAVVADALIATRRVDPETIAARRRGWYGARPQGTAAERRAAALSGAIRVIARHASLRSVWFLNSLRGSLALAAAVLVADQTGVQHGLWVVLGTLSVLRTNAASTGSTALRALGGTVIGFAAGVTAGIRLDEALRGFLAEQGAKRLSKEDLWMLVVATCSSGSPPPRWPACRRWSRPGTTIRAWPARAPRLTRTWRTSRASTSGSPSSWAGPLPKRCRCRSVSRRSSA
jgi:hypothetical protein